ncbi:MAG: FtsX-like permease family protein [Gemmatimonadetes bacterium]|nr:FtsX-like permease family protein [Gemmatimonadota bacterium]NIO32190.1 FtsX-like permease family protein [Gemmatimonadota bacterium]
MAETGTHSGPNRSLSKFYQRWLRWYPTSFRDVYGPGMVQMFNERYDEARAGAKGRAITFVVREFWSVVVTAFSQRAAATAQDVRYTLRSLRNNPGFTTVAVLTLALGIGANTAIFSVVNGVLLRPLPYQDPDRLIRIFEVEPRGGWWFTFSPPNFMSLRDEATLLEDVAAFRETSVTLIGEGDPERLTALRVSTGFFELLGTPLQLGRSFLPEEELAGAAPVVVLSHGVWQRRFGGDREVLGRTIILSDVPRTVVGIVPPTLRFGTDTPELWLPQEFSVRDVSLRGRHFLRVLGRLGPGVELDVAGEELEAISRGLAEAYPETNTEWRWVAAPMRSEIVGGARTPLLMLLGAVGLVLLVACANVANLSLARAESRGREMAVRAAIGAGRTRLLKQLLTESIVLAFIGGVVGLVLAVAGTEVLLASIGSQLPRAAEVSISWPVLLFTMIVTLLAGILVGLIPATQGVRVDLLSALKEGGLKGLAGLGRRRLRGALVVAEVALSLMLVIGAGLLLNSFWRLAHVGAGFSHERVLTARVSLPTAKYETQDERAAFFAGLVDEIQRMPGVDAAAAIEGIPLTWFHGTTVTVPGRPDEDYRVQRRHLTPGYFRALGIPLLAGRDVRETDAADAPRVIVVNETFASRVFPGANAVGMHIAWGGPTQLEDLEIVGVVGDVRAFGLDADAELTMYLPNPQIQTPESMCLVIRTAATSPLSLVPDVRQAVWRLDPDLPLYEVATMEQIMSDSLASQRSWLLLLSIFAAVALLLAAVGIYGVLSYTVSQRTHELGIRLAMGAGKPNVLGLVTRQGMTLVLLGLALGTAGALALSRVLSGLLYEVSANDPTTFAAVVAFILAVALPACYLPARRAASVDPMEALRYE